MRPPPSLALLALPLLASLALTSPAASASDENASATTGPDAAVNGDRGVLHSHGPDGLDLDRRGRPEGPQGPTLAAETVDTTLTGTWSSTSTLPVVGTEQADAYGGLPSIHLVYVYPSDLKTPRTKFLTMFEADARAAQKLLMDRYGRSIRFDETTAGRLDITTVRSAYRTRQLGGSTQFDLVKRDLSRVFPDSESPRKKYLAWLDAPSQYCGQGELYGDWHRDTGNWNDLRTTGVVYRPYSSGSTDGGFCRGRTLLHELGHNLGALYGKAPSAFDGAHCNDDKNDVMCYQSAVTSGVDTSATSTGQFDYGNTDYWDVGAVVDSVNGGPEIGGAHLKHLNWWTVNLSRFVCRPHLQGTTLMPANCAEPGAVYPTVDEFRYHSGAETSPPPATVPTA